MGVERVRPFFSSAHKKVLFFDMNDTLIDQQRTFTIGFKEALKEYTGRWNKTGADWSSDTIWNRYQAEWKRRSSPSRKKRISKTELQQICMRHALAPYPFTINDAMVRAFFRQIRSRRHLYAVLFPDVLNTLKVLSRHYKLAVISNGDREQIELHCERLGLDTYFPKNHLFTSKKIGYAKPNIAIYLHAVKALNIQPAQGIMIGNSWKNDIYGATRAGLDAIWIHPTHVKKTSQRKVGKERVAIIRHFGQLTQIIATGGR